VIHKANKEKFSKFIQNTKILLKDISNANFLESSMKTLINKSEIRLCLEKNSLITENHMISGRTSNINSQKLAN